MRGFTPLSKKEKIMSKTKIHNQLEGRVVSNKMAKTIVIEVRRSKEHPRYKKRINITKKFKAHDEKNECQIGDLVLIESCRPMSKEKKWRFVKILKKAINGELESNNANSAEVGA